ncbi:MAG: DUF1232 domain-containing protein [Sphingobacteriales bacterium]|jgi:uncharacterized membrane protein YkvA (DUF1232 family)|nr:DUF1232 domain-containing protein [Sphingobacteriales bacterium]
MDNSLLSVILRYYYPETSRKVQDIVASHEKLEMLTAKVYGKLEKSVQQYADISGRLMDLTGLLDAWRKKEYTDISYLNLILGVFILVYFVSPYDVIPDFIPFAGKVDDDFVLQRGFAMLDIELEKFRRWNMQR